MQEGNRVSNWVNLNLHEEPQRPLKPKIQKRTNHHCTSLKDRVTKRSNLKTFGINEITKNFHRNESRA
jgi:hypothetical protein